VGNTSACYGDSVTLFSNIGPGYSYQWYDSVGPLTGDTLSYIVAGQSNNYKCQVTPPNGCSAFSNIISITIKPQLVANFSLPTSACKNDIVSINFTGISPLGASYNWNFDNGMIASGSNAGPYGILWDSDSTKTVSLSITNDGCTSESNDKPISILSTNAQITALGGTSFCDGGSVSLSANAGNFSYEWFKNGVSTGISTPIYTAVLGGNYQVEVTNNTSSCVDLSDSVLITVNTNDFNLAFTANPTNFTIPPFNTQFTNQTPSTSNFYWQWNLGDGNNSNNVSPSHQYIYDGNYTVGVVAQNISTGCFDTLVKQNYISCQGGSTNPCTLNASVGSSGQHQICPEDSVRLFSKEHGSGVSYQWLKDGVLISGQTDSVFFANQTGNFQVMVADTSCSVFSQPYPITLHTTITPLILANGSIQPCSNDSMELFVSTAFSSYQWSTGASSPNIFVNISGSYIVMGTDVNGCQTSSIPYVVNASFLQAPEICIVGVDTATNHNKIIWEKHNSAQIDSFKIYKESTTAGIYNLIGSQPFSTIAVFEDTISNTAQQAYRYRITAIDSCGMETAPSQRHQTIHLTINAGMNNSWNLIWNNYEGFNFGSYRIYRGTDSLKMQLLTQIQSTLNSFTDLNPPSGNVYYQIEIVSPHPCYPDSIYSKAQTNYNTSRSNTTNTSTAPNIGFKNYDVNTILVNLYPNPNKGKFVIDIFGNKKKSLKLQILDPVGRQVYTEEFMSNGLTSKAISLKNIASGVYFIRLSDGSKLVYMGKVVIGTFY